MMRNQSGYPDPTAEAAINHVMSKQADESRPLVYICIPLNCPYEEGLETAAFVCNQAIKEHKTPVCPFMFLELFYGPLDTEEKRRALYEMDKEYLLNCSEIWVVNESLPPCVCAGFLDPDDIDLPCSIVRAFKEKDKKGRKGCPDPGNHEKKERK